MAAAHLDSINSIGPQYYPPDVVRDWGAGVTSDLYLRAMEGGEVFFIAVGEPDGDPMVLGFSSHRIDDGIHGVSVYVRGGVARRGIGSALLGAAEADAVAGGATSIQIDGSLAAVEFYKKHGYVELRRGIIDLSTGHQMPCVFMRKTLATT